MLSVVYKNRALPIAWLVAQGSKGHFSEENHMTLVEQVEAIIPEGTEIMFLGDGEFDGIELQAKIEGYGWNYVCRTAKDTILNQSDKSETFENLGVWRGGRITLSNVTITRNQYGPVQAVYCCIVAGTNAGLRVNPA